MIADVAGYGRLSQVDEEGTRARFQANLNDIFVPSIAAHRGRLVKTMGDGILVEFQSVINALRCAVDIQRAEAELNAGAPADERLEFRIAINLGDVIVEGDDIHGNGVNIADRLQALARPGGVVISGTAYDQVTNRLDVGYEFLGEQRMKNIAEPVRVYGVLTGLTSPAPAALPPGPKVEVAQMVLAGHRGCGRRRDSRQERRRGCGRGSPPPPRRPRKPPPRRRSRPPRPRRSAPPPCRRHAVARRAPVRQSERRRGAGLPRRWHHRRPDDGAGAHPGLFVISRNAAFTYKGKAMQPAIIASELGVRYLLEGSIRRVGDDIRINAQLIDGESSGHMWAERFDGAWAEVFDLQDQMVEQIATALKLRLVESQRAAQIVGGTSNPAAYDAFLRGVELEGRRTPEDTASAVTQYQQALALDPNFGRAWASLAWLYWNLHDPEQEKAMGITWRRSRTELRRLCGRPKSTPRRPTIRSSPICSFGSRGRMRRLSLRRRPLRSMRAIPGTMSR